MLTSNDVTSKLERNSHWPTFMTRFSDKFPIWYQLSQSLRKQILSGKFMPGQKLAPETQMAKDYAISVMPVRQALRALEEEGLILRQRGRGTFVAQDIVLAPPSSTSLEALYSKEFDKPARIIEMGTAATPSEFAEQFPDLEEMAFYRRVAYRDNKAWSYGCLYFPQEHLEQLTADLLSKYPLYRLLKEECAIELCRSSFEAKAISVTAQEADYLELEPLSPALFLKAVSFDENNVAVGAFEMTFKSDPFIFSFETSHMAV